MKYIKTFPRAGYWITVIFVLFITQNLHSQDEWTEPIPLTDSLTNNTNPDIRRIYFNEEQRLYMAWEKSTDSLSTAINMKDILNFNAEIEVISDPSIHYTNPKIFPLNYNSGENDTLFFLFYESSFSGNQDIYYMAYTSQGNFTEPEAFFNTDGDDQAVDCNLNNDIVWTRSGDLVYSNFDPYSKEFIEPVLIDSNKCSSPKMNYNYHVLWQREDSNETHIYRADWAGSNSWSDPILVFDSGFATNLNKDALESSLYTWSAYTDSIWKLYTYTTGLNSYLIEYDLIQNEPFDPATTPYVIGIKSTQDNCFCNISFPYDEDGYKEIYLNPEPESSFINISNSGTDNRNPNMFLGETDNMTCFWIYDVWESFRNEHWQLYFSKIMMCISEVEEIESKKNFINVSPNPFLDEVIVTYNLNEQCNVKIEIADLYGKRIMKIFDGNQNRGKQTIKWTTSKTIPSGIYFIILSKENERYSQKIIKSQ